jgi:hypothetical protein
MPTKKFRNRKRGEYTSIIKPFKNPASPIIEVGIDKK